MSSLAAAFENRRTVQIFVSHIAGGSEYFSSRTRRNPS
jgi:hypothetical protein